MAEKKHSGLGKGLDSIFGTDVGQFLDDIQNNAAEVPGRREMNIPIDEIRPNPYQPRKEFDKKALEELADSIATHGIFTPLLVRKSVAGYDLIAGERRLRAAKIAKLTTVPCIVVDFTEEQMMEIAILENVQREDLNPIEEAIAYDSLVKKLGYTQEKLAERIGKSREYCANIMRLLRLPSEVQTMVIDKKLTMSHVRPLLALEDEQQMYDVAQKIAKEKMSVREVEQYIHTLNGTKPKVKNKNEDPMLVDLQNHLSQKLSTKVKVTSRGINISYHDVEDLNRILELLDCLNDE